MSNELIFCRVLFFFSRSLRSVFCVGFFSFSMCREHGIDSTKTGKSTNTNAGDLSSMIFSELGICWQQPNIQHRVTLFLVWNTLEQPTKSNCFAPHISNRNEWRWRTIQSTQNTEIQTAHTHEREKSKKSIALVQRFKSTQCCPYPYSFHYWIWMVETLYTLYKKGEFRVGCASRRTLGPNIYSYNHRNELSEQKTQHNLITIALLFMEKVYLVVYLLRLLVTWLASRFSVPWSCFCLHEKQA